MICKNCNRDFNPDASSPRCPHIPYSFGANQAAVDAVAKTASADMIDLTGFNFNQGEIYVIGISLDHVVTHLKNGKLEMPDKDAFFAVAEPLIELLASKLKVDM